MLSSYDLSKLSFWYFVIDCTKIINLGWSTTLCINMLASLIEISNLSMLNFQLIFCLMNCTQLLSIPIWMNTVACLIQTLVSDCVQWTMSLVIIGDLLLSAFFCFHLTELWMAKYQSLNLTPTPLKCLWVRSPGPWMKMICGKCSRNSELSINSMFSATKQRARARVGNCWVNGR